MLGTQSGRPKGLAMVGTSLGKGHLGQALMENRGVREGTVSKALEVAWDEKRLARPDLWAAHTAGGGGGASKPGVGG